MAWDQVCKVPPVTYMKVPDRKQIHVVLCHQAHQHRYKHFFLALRPITACAESNLDQIMSPKYPTRKKEGNLMIAALSTGVRTTPSTVVSECNVLSELCVYTREMFKLFNGENEQKTVVACRWESIRLHWLTITRAAEFPADLKVCLVTRRIETILCAPFNSSNIPVPGTHPECHR